MQGVWVLLHKLRILELLRTYTRVLYLGIDCHHGDGVEEAFYMTDRVMTCNIHKFGDFFFLGWGHSVIWGKGMGYSINISLKDGITDRTFRSVFDLVSPNNFAAYHTTHTPTQVTDKTLKVYRPSVVVSLSYC